MKEQQWMRDLYKLIKRPLPPTKKERLDAEMKKEMKRIERKGNESISPNNL